MLRVYVLFMGDYASAAPWSESSVKGCKRFLERVAGLSDILSDDEVTPKLESAFHKTVKKVSQDIEDMKYNTAIAAMMTLINDIYDHGSLTRDELSVFVRLLCPFAPHLCEEIWQQLGGEGFCSLASWPEYDEAKCVDSTVEIAVQVSGKLKFTKEIPLDTPRDEAIALVKADDRMKQYLEGKTIVKEISVPNKIVNIVVK